MFLSSFYTDSSRKSYAFTACTREKAKLHTKPFVQGSASLAYTMSSFFADEDDDAGIPQLPPPPRWSTNAQASASKPSELFNQTGRSSSRLPSSTASASRASSVGIGSLLDDSNLQRGLMVEDAMDLDLGYGMDEEDLDDVRRMGRVWVRERGTVDLMAWEGDLIDTLFDKLEQQVCLVHVVKNMLYVGTASRLMLLDCSKKC